MGLRRTYCTTKAVAIRPAFFFMLNQKQRDMRTNYIEALVDNLLFALKLKS